MKAFFSIGLILLVSVVAFAGGPPPPPHGPCCWPPNPKPAVDWWRFDEPSGTTSADIAGTQNNIGTDHGSIPRTAGTSSKAIQLQGSQWVQVANGPEVNFLGDCNSNNAESGTIAFWIVTSSASGVVTIIDKRTSTSTSLVGYSVYLWNGRLGFQMATGTGNQSCNSTGSACSNFIATTLASVADGNWHFVAVSFSRCGTPTGLFYVDGTTAPFTPRVGDMTNTSDLYIGRTVPGMSVNYVTGWLDEMMFFKAAYTKTDLDSIRADYCYTKCWR